MGRATRQRRARRAMWKYGAGYSDHLYNHGSTRSNAVVERAPYPLVVREPLAPQDVIDFPLPCHSRAPGIMENKYVMTRASTVPTYPTRPTGPIRHQHSSLFDTSCDRMRRDA